MRAVRGYIKERLQSLNTLTSICMRCKFAAAFAASLFVLCSAISAAKLLPYEWPYNQAHQFMQLLLTIMDLTQA